MPQYPATGNTRGVAAIRAGGPKGPVKRVFLVSASRQGGMATKAMGGVGTVALASTAGWTPYSTASRSCPALTLAENKSMPQGMVTARIAPRMCRLITLLGAVLGAIEGR